MVKLSLARCLSYVVRTQRCKAPKIDSLSAIFHTRYGIFFWPSVLVEGLLSEKFLFTSAATARRLIKKSFLEDNFTSAEMQEISMIPQELPEDSQPTTSLDLIDAENCPTPFGIAVESKLKWKATAKKITTTKQKQRRGNKASQRSRQKLLLQGPIAAFAASTSDKKR